MQAIKIHAGFSQGNGAIGFRIDQRIKRSASGREVRTMPKLFRWQMKKKVILFLRASASFSFLQMTRGQF